jgi:hypothetical protein
MDTPESQFSTIDEKLAAENEAITMGKMMSSPGIRYHDKVFAFFYKGGMVLRFGRGFDPASMGVDDYSLLSPFKTSRRCWIGSRSRPRICSSGKRWHEWRCSG